MVVSKPVFQLEKETLFFYLDRHARHVAFDFIKPLHLHKGAELRVIVVQMHLILQQEDARLHSRNADVRHRHVISNSAPNVVSLLYREVKYMDRLGQALNVRLKDHVFTTFWFFNAQHIVQRLVVITGYLLQEQRTFAQVTAEIFPVVTVDALIVLRLFFAAEPTLETVQVDVAH